MAIFSPLRTRRYGSRPTEKTHQIIRFRLRQEWFCLPIQSVLKVVPMGKIYGDPNGKGISVTLYNDQELLVVDVGHQIFQESPSPDLASQYSQNEERYLLLLQNKAGTVVGLPIDSSPAIGRVPESSFKSLPEGYLSQGNIQCVSSVVVETNEQPLLFLLNPNQII